MTTTPVPERAAPAVATAKPNRLGRPVATAAIAVAATLATVFVVNRISGDETPSNNYVFNQTTTRGGGGNSGGAPCVGGGFALCGAPVADPGAMSPLDIDDVLGVP